MEQLKPAERATAPEGPPDLLARAARFTRAAEAAAIGANPYFLPLERHPGGEVRWQGRPVLMLGSNDYLGLSRHEAVREAAARAARDQGASLNGSPFLNGSSPERRALEEALAEFLGCEDALLFASGYQANLGLLSALLRRGDTALVDRECHASAYDGLSLAGCRLLRFRHSDVEHFHQRLEELDPARSLVLVDGLYSMLGDLAPLEAIVPACAARGVPLVVDDAHGLGTLGDTGRGTLEALGLAGQAPLIVGTCSKSLAAVGGWVAGPRAVLDYVRYHGRALLFSAALPPPAVAAARAALGILRAEPQRVARLRELARGWRTALAEHGLGPPPPPGPRGESPVVPIPVGDEERCIQIALALLEDEGVYLNPVIPPGVPPGQALLRSSLDATMRAEELERGLAALLRVLPRFGLGA